VTYGAYVAVRLGALKFLFCHFVPLLPRRLLLLLRLYQKTEEALPFDRAYKYRKILRVCQGYLGVFFEKIAFFRFFGNFYGDFRSNKRQIRCQPFQISNA
jgi:hypothetical protein